MDGTGLLQRVSLLQQVRVRCEQGGRWGRRGRSLTYCTQDTSKRVGGNTLPVMIL